MGTFILVALALLVLVPLISGIGRGLCLKSVDFMVSSSKKLANTMSRLACDKFLSAGCSRSSIMPIREAKIIIQECTSKCDHSFDELRNITCSYIEALSKKAGGYTFAMIMAEVHLYSQSRAIVQSLQEDFYANHTGSTVLQAIFEEAFAVGKQAGLFDDSGSEGGQLVDIPFEIIKRFNDNLVLEKWDRALRSRSPF